MHPLKIYHTMHTENCKYTQRLGYKIASLNKYCKWSCEKYSAKMFFATCIFPTSKRLRQLLTSYYEKPSLRMPVSDILRGSE
jgi:hypothetical protein